MLTAAVKTGDLLDLALIALAVLVGVRGYRQGLLVGAASLIGFIGGALIGTVIAGPVAGLFPPGTARLSWRWTARPSATTCPGG